MSWLGKVFVITGGASGIGLATAQLLAEKGAKVSIADVNEKNLREAETWFQNKGSEAFLTKVNVTQRKDVDAWIAATVSRYGSIDGAVNAAGYGGKHYGTMSVEDMDDDEWDSVISVNLTGMMYGIRSEIKAINDGGSIVNISSCYGLSGAAMGSAYSASKHAIIGLTRSAAKECASKSVRVNAVCPGIIATPLVAEALKVLGDKFQDPGQLQRFGTSEEVASMIVWLLGPESTFVTGAVQVIDGGWNC